MKILRLKSGAEKAMRRYRLEGYNSGGYHAFREVDFPGGIRLVRRCDAATNAGDIDVSGNDIAIHHNTDITVRLTVDGVDRPGEVVIGDSSDDTNGLDADSSEQIEHLRITGLPNGIGVENGHFVGDVVGQPGAGIWYVDLPSPLVMDGTQKTYDLKFIVSGDASVYTLDQSDVVISVINKDGSAVAVHDDVTLTFHRASDYDGSNSDAPMDIEGTSDINGDGVVDEQDGYTVDPDLDLASISDEELTAVIESTTGHEAVSEEAAMEHVADMLIQYGGVESEDAFGDAPHDAPVTEYNTVLTVLPEGLHEVPGSMPFENIWQDINHDMSVKDVILSLKDMLEDVDIERHASVDVSGSVEQTELNDVQNSGLESTAYISCVDSTVQVHIEDDPGLHMI